MKNVWFLVVFPFLLLSCSPEESPEDTAAYEDMELLSEPKGSFKSVLLETNVSLSPDAQLGYAVASNAYYAVLGAPGYNHGRGAVLLYTKRGTSYVYHSMIEPPADMPDQEGRFGATLSMTDSYLVIGGNAGDEAEGIAYLYVNDGENWRLSGGNLRPENTADCTVGGYGVSVSVSESGYLVVGAPETKVTHPLGAGLQETGYVFVYDIVNGVASLSTQDVRPDFITANSDFGRSVACYAEDLIVGAPNLNGDRGGVFIYTRTNGRFARTGGNESAATDFYSGSHIGMAVAIGSRYAVVGNGIGNRAFNYPRSALVYVKEAGNWKSYMASTSYIKGYGATVATFGDRVLVGAPYVSRSKGAVFIYRQNGNEWTNIGGGYLKPGVKPGDAFGSAISAFSETYLVGTPGINGSEGGAYSAVVGLNAE